MPLCCWFYANSAGLHSWLWTAYAKLCSRKSVIVHVFETFIRIKSKPLMILSCYYSILLWILGFILLDINTKYACKTMLTEKYHSSTSSKHSSESNLNHKLFIIQFCHFTVDFWITDNVCETTLTKILVPRLSNVHNKHKNKS